MSYFEAIIIISHVHKLYLERFIQPTQVVLESSLNTQNKDCSFKWVIAGCSNFEPF